MDARSFAIEVPFPFAYLVGFGITWIGLLNGRDNLVELFRSQGIW